MRATVLVPVPLLLLLLAACGGGSGSGGSPTPTPNVSVPFDAADFSGAAVDNPFFPLVPGRRLAYEGETEEGFERVEVEVTSSTRVVLGVACVVVRSVESVDGEVVEDTEDWFAQDDDGNVWYFGEDSKEVEDGEVVSTEGSWEAGVDGAMPGIVMLAAPSVGLVYQQEDAPGVAEDRAEVVGTGEPVSTPLDDFTGCLHTEDFTPLEPGVVEDKWYAPGVGLVLEVDEDGNRIELVEVD